MKLPPWVVLHVPHDSTVIPPEVREQFVLSDLELEREIDRLTDHHTFDLFANEELVHQVVWARFSRLVVDVERFADDRDEPMAKRGLGAVYTHTAAGARLRRELLPSERASLLQNYYVPHHARLAERVSAAIAAYGQCLVIDCHSFPDEPLPYENGARGEPRPDICIGTDAFHTNPSLRDAFVAEFTRLGWSVQVNTPFAGALVPAEHYRSDSRVAAIMVEVNRALYLDPYGARPVVDFAWVAHRVQAACVRAVGMWHDEATWPEHSSAGCDVDPNCAVGDVAKDSFEAQQELGESSAPASDDDEEVESKGPSYLVAAVASIREMLQSLGHTVTKDDSPEEGENTYIATFVSRSRPVDGHKKP
jgi:N-formylglutamate deformylase